MYNNFSNVMHTSQYIFFTSANCICENCKKKTSGEIIRRANKETSSETKHFTSPVGI